MKAIIVKSFGAPSVMQLTELSKPKLNETGEVLLKIAGIGVNPVETYIRAGNYAKLPNLPYTPGTDCVGVVEKEFHEYCSCPPSLQPPQLLEIQKSDSGGQTMS